MRVLLTGGAGFIGSHLLERLIARGDEVAVIDDFNDYYDPAIKRRNLPRGGFRLHERDIRQSAEVVAREKPDVVVHLAARAGVRPSLADPALYDSVNVAGTLTLLEACRRNGVGRFLFASSSSVYGNGRAPASEDDEPLQPISPYGISKLVGEQYVRIYSHLHGLRSTCLRFFTVYGPRQRPDMAIHAFTGAIAEGREITVYGDGSTERDYTHVSDILQGILSALDRPEAFGVYNLGESRTVPLRRVIELLEENLGRKARIRQMPEQPGDVRRTFASIDRARERLAYRPEISIEDGLRDWVAWYRKA
ncbi:MAG TPA: NAD-dependent epimerase/dehydratase family protein [Planctomycetota bacterium]|jgi:UDP-glucuronate 4-epimerase|nr:NAD-dependent epimerase/dehydratase family protein [Planctomycetota bacterium]